MLLTTVRAARSGQFREATCRKGGTPLFEAGGFSMDHGEPKTILCWQTSEKGRGERETMNRRAVLLGLALVLGAAQLGAQETYPLHPDTLDGVWQGYAGEWRHVSNQLVALAEAIPAEKFTWRPAPGVRSVSEVYMHITMANLYL